jgi:hypothetical protein
MCFFVSHRKQMTLSNIMQHINPVDRRKRDVIINITHFLTNDELHCSKDATILVWIYLMLDRFSRMNVYDYLPTNKQTNKQKRKANQPTN